jgi:hypothetical protein
LEPSVCSPAEMGCCKHHWQNKINQRLTMLDRAPTRDAPSIPRRFSGR